MKIRKITAKNFQQYGRVIEFPRKERAGKRKNLFSKVIIENNKTGWRIAYLVVRDKRIKRMEQHLFSLESFEPVKGESLLYVAKEKNPEEISCFYLDHPVVLYKGIWHGVVTLGRESEIKITENAKVTMRFWPLTTFLLGGKI